MSRVLRQSYVDAFYDAGSGRGCTFRKLGVAFRLDYIYCGPDWAPVTCDVIHTPEAAVASDHFPLVARIDRRELAASAAPLPLTRAGTFG